MNKVLRVLMVEDSTDDVLLALHSIKQGGYTVYSERVDTEEDLVKILHNTWDIILSDYSMPNLSGMKALQIVREHDEEIPFIIVSGTIGEEKAVFAIKSGANDYVNKLHLVLLLPAIERVFEEKRIKKENQATKLALEETKERFYHAFHHTGTGVALVDLNCSLMEINAAFCNLLGYNAEQLLFMKIDDLIDESSKQLFNETLSPILNHEIEHTEVELRLIHKNAQKLWVILNVSLVKHASPNKPHYLIIQFQDRTEQRYFEEKLLYLTTYNALTGLLNRGSLFNKINELIQNKTIEQFAIYYIDIDRFKRVNEIYGAHLGDYLLKNIASQLKNRTAAHEVLGYLGGKEFMLIEPNPTSEEKCIKLGADICSSLLEPILMQNNELTLTASLGICQYPKDGKSVTELLKAANIALRESKNRGGDCFTLYNPSLYRKSSNALIIESNLRKAIGAKELRVHYQPQIDALTGLPSGMEALIRWQKNGALILPDEFIPIAEESSLILKIGEEILTQVCSYFSELKKTLAHNLPKRISVNLSGRQFADDQLLPMLKNVLKTQNFPPGQLEIEITETTLIQNIEVVYATLHKIGEMGIQIAIDDFGTGYSSLGYLKDLPINRLKIDKSFVDSCLFDYNSQSIIASIITLAHRIGLEVTAEGVENEEQRQFLMKHHCDEFQGYYFSPPIAQENLSAFFSKFNQ